MTKIDKYKIIISSIISLIVLRMIEYFAIEYLNQVYIIFVIILLLFTFLLRFIFKKKFLYNIPLIISTVLILIAIFFSFITRNNPVDNDEGYLIWILVYSSFIFFAASFASLALGLIVEYKFFRKEKIICNKTILKYNEIALLILIIWIIHDKYFTMIDSYHDVRHIAFILIFLLLDVLYLGIDLTVRYIIRIKKLHFEYIAVILLLTIYLFLPLPDIFDNFDFIDRDLKDSLILINLSLYTYIMFALIRRIYTKRDDFVSTKYISESVNNGLN